MKLKHVLIPTTLALLVGCAADERPEDAFRVLPVAGISQDGKPVLVGTYDEETQEVSLVPAFVDELEAAAESPVRMNDGEASQPLTTVTTWDEPLDEGAVLDLVADDGDKSVTGGRLVIHAEDWTDGLTEAEAASSFAGCWDPCSFWDVLCTDQEPQQA